MFNCILLSKDEKYISFLDDESLDITYYDEIGEIPSISVSYPLSENMRLDRENFKVGNKIFLYGEGIVTKLYVIVESTAFDFVKENNIEFRAEDVLTELNFAPFFIQDSTEYKYPINNTNLDSWFGDYFDIGEVDTVGVTDDYKKVHLLGTMTKMELLRTIEESTGNYFKTEYYLTKNNEIRRVLHFKKQNALGREHDSISELIDLTYNAENINYTIDESDTFTAISPVLSIDTDSSSQDVSQQELNIVINDFLDIGINKGEIVPMIISNNNSNEIYPFKDEGIINNYWRRIPGDSLFTWYEGLFEAQNSASFFSPTRVMLSSGVSTHEGHMYQCQEDGDYTYWNGSTLIIEECKTGDICVCNGEAWSIVHQESNENVVKFVYCDGKYWKAPFRKVKGDFYVENIANEDIQYDKVYLKPNKTNNGFKTPVYPKIGSVDTSELDAFSILNVVHNKLIDKENPKVEIDIDVKDLEGTTNYDLFDKVYVKIPSFEKIINAQIIKVEKNPHMPSENKITISTEHNITSAKTVIKKSSVIILNTNEEVTEFETTGFTVGGTLVAYDENNERVPLANKLVNINISVKGGYYEYTRELTSPSFTETQKNIKEQTYWDKQGRNPSWSQVCGIGHRSAPKADDGISHDTGSVDKWWKGIYGNGCPVCKHARTLIWKYGGDITDRSKHYFECTNCHSTFSVQGNQKQSPWFTLKKISLIEGNNKNGINEVMASNLKNGKLIFSQAVNETVTKTIKGTTKKVTYKVPMDSKSEVVMTNEDGEFILNTSLPPIYDNNYTLEYTYGGDSEYNSCSARNEIYINVENNSTGATSSSGSTTSRTIEPIPRPDNSGIYSIPVTDEIKQKGISIVGNRSGEQALRKVAEEVAKFNYKENLGHNYGFYQSPQDTLKNRYGNDECLCELICQLLEGAGILQDYIRKNQALYFIVVGGHTYLKYVDDDGNIKYIDPVMDHYVFGRYNILYEDTDPTNFEADNVCAYPQLPFSKQY